jgi:hypothetical protein
MSGVAAIAGPEANQGLIPRYVRDSSADAEVDTRDRVSRGVPRPVALMDGAELTEELRRRISDTAKPERRSSRPLWLGVAALAAIAASASFFPDVVLALVPRLSMAL